MTVSSVYISCIPVEKSTIAHIPRRQFSGCPRIQSGEQSHLDASSGKGTLDGGKLLLDLFEFVVKVLPGIFSEP